MSRTVFSHDEATSRMVWPNGDIQRNVDGAEYRVITVGAKVDRCELRGIFEEWRM